MIKLIEVFSLELHDVNNSLYNKFKLNFTLDGRKMFLRDGKINPYFNMNEFEMISNTYMIYVSYIDADEVTDCFDYGFDNVKYTVKKKFYNNIAIKSQFNYAIIRLPISADNIMGAKKIFSNSYFNYYVIEISQITIYNESAVFAIIFSDRRLNESINKRIVNCDIRYIHSLITNSCTILLKMPVYASYNYIVFFQKEKRNDISKAVSLLYNDLSY